MVIKVQCACGTRFQFEVTPVNGRMPVAIHCPTCNADDTELANALIQQQLSAAAAAVPAPTATPAPTPTPAPASGLRVAGLHRATPQPAAAPANPAPPAAVAESAEPAAEFCPKHKTETAIDTCKVCGKPICLKCMEQFGYVCSVYCRQQATAQRIYIPVCPHQKSVIAGRSHAMAKWITAGVVTLIVLLLGFWFWYAWFAREPKVVYSLPIPKPNENSPRAFSRPDEFYELIGPGQLLSIKNKQVSLFDVNEQHQIWSSPLQSGVNKAAADGEEGDFYFGEPRVAATSNDVWVAYSGKLLRFDRQTGSSRDAGIKEKIRNVTMGQNSIIVLAGDYKGPLTLMKISLPDGGMQADEILASPSTKSEPKKPSKTSDGAGSVKNKPAVVNSKLDHVPVGQLKTLATQGQATSGNESNSSDEDPYPLLGYSGGPLIEAGPNVVEMTLHVLEHKTVSHQAMKPKGKSVLDDANLNASQSLDLAQEMMNDSRRAETGGVEIEDVSRYQVTIHRLLDKGVADWTGEVTGPPQFFPLKTVDVLVAGQGLVVFDKQNKKLWEAKLTFPVVRHFSEEHPPCMQVDDALYFADAGTLTRFDLASGSVRWRYNTVGISRMTADERGGIYIVTTTAGPEQIQYSQEVNLKNKIKPVIMKLDAATSKVLWREESVGDELMLSGKFLYATHVTLSYAALRLEDGPDTHFNLKLLNPSNGNEIWNFHRGNRLILKTEVQKNWILLHMDDEVVVLKFFSL